MTVGNMAMRSFRRCIGVIMVAGLLPRTESWVLTIELAEHIVKVPEMAESITEGTLKQWSKRR